MANKNFRVRNGLEIGDNISVTDTGTATGITTLASASNGNITLAPNGTGDVLLTADRVQIGDNSAPATFTTNGTGDLLINTNNGTNAGSITLTNGVNGNITIAPNGTGSLALTLADGGNLTNTRNYVKGTLRNSTLAAAGEIWAVNSTGPVAPYQGISIDNSADTTTGPGTVIRSFSGGAVSGSATRGRLVFEKARGTSASPTAVQSGDQLGSVDITGYTSTGWVNDNIATVIPGTFIFAAAENWISNTNLGTTFAISQAPTATTITGAGNLIATLTVSPQASASRSDSFTWANGKTGTTQTMALDVSGNLTITGDLRVNGNDIKGSGGNNAITLTSGNTATTVVGDTFSINNATGINYFQTYKDGSNKVTASVNQTRATTGNEHAAFNFTTQRSADGINYTPTQSGDILGQFKFNGNANTSTSPGVPAGPGAQISATATELWSPTQNGAKIDFTVIKKGATTDVTAISAASDSTTFKSDSYTFQDSGATANYLTLNSTNTTSTANTFTQVSNSPTTFTITGSSISGTTLTVGTLSAGTIANGSYITGTGVTAGTYIISNIAGGTGSGSTWLVSASQTVSSTTITGTKQNLILNALGLSYDRVYGDFSSTQTQTNAGPTSVNIVTFDTTNYSQSISIVAGTKITISRAGSYQLQWSGQCEKTDNGADQVTIWLRQNGVDIPNSAGVVTLNGNNAKVIAAWTYSVTAAANDYFELCWFSADTHVELVAIGAGTTPTRPAAPSVALTVVPIGA